jgi:hypothetical protein
MWATFERVNGSGTAVAFFDCAAADRGARRLRGIP